MAGSTPLFALSYSYSFSSSLLFLSPISFQVITVYDTVTSSLSLSLAFSVRLTDLIIPLTFITQSVQHTHTATEYICGTLSWHCNYDSLNRPNINLSDNWPQFVLFFNCWKSIGWRKAQCWPVQGVLTWLWKTEKKTGTIIFWLSSS